MGTSHISGFHNFMKSGFMIINKGKSWEEVHKLQEMIYHLHF